MLNIVQHHTHTHTHAPLTFFPHPLGEVCESLPLCGVHMDVFSVTDVFIVDNVVVNSLGPCGLKPKLIVTIYIV